MSSLPLPPEELAAHGGRVLQTIRDEIARAGGWIDFARYMELALYAPGLGYYSAGMQKFGAGGDFVTAPEISPLYGRTLAKQVAQVLEGCGGDVLELGAGTGRLAAQLLGELQRLQRLPQRYLILEVSPYLRVLQQETLRREVPDLCERIVWLDRLPEAFTGCVVGNEVLDALPVHLVAQREEGPAEHGVGVEAERLVWRERPLQAGPLYEAATALALPSGYRTEINLAAPALIASLANILRQGALLFIDYGFSRREYYHPQRAEGTLMCHYRHHAHGDPLLYPGLQDITAHVDFTAVALAGVKHDLQALGYATQAQFLINCGITGLLAEADPERAGRYLPLAAQVQKLVSPAEMGELFKVLALGKGIASPLLGFLSGDRRQTL